MLKSGFPACPLCGSTARTALFAAFDRMHRHPGVFSVLRCGCGLRSTWPQPEDLGRYYPAGYYAYGRVGPPPFYGAGLKGLLRTLVLHYQYGYRYGPRGARLPERGPLAALLRRVTRPLRWRGAAVFGPGPLPPAPAAGQARALDVGCGSGGWLLKLQALGWIVTGVEFSADGVAAARAAGLTVHHGELADVDLPVAGFDLIRVWHTLEHVPDPAGLLRAAAGLLRPGGTLLIGVPNAGGWMARIFGTRWFDLDVPRHLWHFTPLQLRQLVTNAGLRPVRLTYGFYGGYTLLRCFQYIREEIFGYTPAGRATFERRWDAVRRRRWLWPLRRALRALERSNHLELTAVREEP